LYSYSSLTIREKFLRLNDKDKDENNPGSITPAKTQDDNKKIGNEIYYFIGAGVIAAIIYFLVPDKEPASKTNYTFGLPVTPK